MKVKKVIGWILLSAGSVYPVMLIVIALDRFASGTLRSMTFSVPILVASFSIFVIGFVIKERGNVRKEKGE